METEGSLPCSQKPATAPYIHTSSRKLIFWDPQYCRIETTDTKEGGPT
jgi:hypothetical protein